jgi:hypothetical protein
MILDLPSASNLLEINFPSKLRQVLNPAPNPFVPASKFSVAIPRSLHTFGPAFSDPLQRLILMMARHLCSQEIGLGKMGLKQQAKGFAVARVRPKDEILFLHRPDPFIDGITLSANRSVQKSSGSSQHDPRPLSNPAS